MTDNEHKPVLSRVLEKNAGQTLHSHFFTNVDEIFTREIGPKWTAYRTLWKRAGIDHFIPSFPIHLDLEIAGRCNLKCRMCNRQLNPGYRPNSGLPMELIRRIFDEASWYECYSVLFGMDDETLIEKEKFFTAAGIAKEAGLFDIWLSTNGVLLDEDTSHKAIDRRITRIVISLDAATAKTYRRIRGLDRYEAVLDNIQDFLRLRAAAGSKLPVLRLSFVVLPDNAAEQENFLDLWRDKADAVIFQSCIDVSVDPDALDPAGTESFFKDHNSCPQPFRRIAIDGNGNVYPCCTIMDDKPVLGNIRDSAIHELWNSRFMRRIQQMSLKGTLPFMKNCRRCLLSARGT